MKEKMIRVSDESVIRISSLEKAAQVWCGKETSNLVMDNKLVKEFAVIIDAYEDTIEEILLYSAPDELLHDSAPTEDTNTRTVSYGSDNYINFGGQWLNIRYDEDIVNVMVKLNGVGILDELAKTMTDQIARVTDASDEELALAYSEIFTRVQSHFYGS